MTNTNTNMATVMARVCALQFGDNQSIVALQRPKATGIYQIVPALIRRKLKSKYSRMKCTF